MRIDRAEELRSSLRQMASRRSGSSRGFIVRDQTVLAAHRAAKMLDELAGSGAFAGGVHLTRPGDDGTTINVCICGINHCGDGSVAG